MNLLKTNQMQKLMDCFIECDVYITDIPSEFNKGEGVKVPQVKR